MENVISSNVNGSKHNSVTKNIYLLLAGKFVSVFGSAIYSFAMSLYILKITGSGLSFSMTLVLSTLPRIILGPVAGVFSDRYDRKTQIVLLDILSGFILLSLWLLSVRNGMQISYIYLATVLLSSCSVFFQTAVQASIPNIVDNERLTKVNSLSEAISSLSSVTGPFIGGFVFALIDIRLFLLINGLSFVLSGISEMFINFNVIKNDSDKSRNAKELSFFASMKEGIDYMMSEKWLWVISMFVVLFNLLTMMGFTIAIPYIVTNVYGFTSQQYGILSAAFPIGMLVASLVLSSLPEKKNYKRLMICIVAFSLGVILLGIMVSGVISYASNWILLGLLSLIYMGLASASAFINIPLAVTMQRMVPDAMRGRVGATVGTLVTSLFPVGAILGGFLVDQITPYYLPVVSGLLMLGLAMFMASVKEIRDI